MENINRCRFPSTFIANWSKRDVYEKIEFRRLGLTDMFVSPLSLGGAHVSKDLVFSADGTQLMSGYESVVKSIRETIKSGINFIDTSPFYGCGRAELVLGKALEEVPRNSYYLATKVGRTGECTFDYSAEWAQKSVELSLKKLGVEYLDVVHVHDVEYSDSIDTIVNETLPALDKLRLMKKVRYIGITGYPLSTLKEVIEKSRVKLDLVLSYCRCTPFDQTLQKYIPFFREKGLGVINAAILGMGLLTSRPLPYWHAARQPIKDACLSAAKYCEERGVDISKICIHYALQQEGIDTHLIGMEDEKALKANLDVMIDGINENERQVLNEMMATIFDKLEVHDWEGIEVNKYRKDPKEFTKFLRGE